MYALSLFSDAVLSLYNDKSDKMAFQADEIRSVHTCLGTPTLGPVLPVDVREPLGGMLTLMEERAQPKVAGGGIRADSGLEAMFDDGQEGAN